ncbi:hypothetical protein Xcel_2222 [Xylanimonas cellulosilytica DSM 15894]|uniref:DUF3375 domain-containing protein n=1 Tax=Xylanimonas cellulosilytica (strain DSM 15894 / JCM 12276 / CECT 5975 / KCTC 9989 / LMG 20990 / NBRC 107835 / XIL07) TaxID=446471 RepID=D1BV01_XYLCX|nr:DUF3375 domain-containing protein [Xylanimonas cellulosilytica]ACZ31240.1 hypothetical protein Xcel_2222 [Xylanimonas cellulosilytica DSM 15894]
MNRVEGAYQGAVRAFRSPMLALLHKRDAPLVVALLSSVFRPDRRTVQVADAHTEMDDALAQLRAAGHDDVSDRSARELCRTWVDAGWLVRQVDDASREAGVPREGAEVYRLSAHAVDALEVASRAGGGHARVSRSRVLTLLEAVERLADDADPDVMTRMLRLQREITVRQAELDRLDRTGEIDPVDEEQLLEAAENVLLLVRELPADFARVAESIRAIQRETVTALRQDARPTGEVLQDYLERAEHLMDATAEGRAFSGAKRLLDDPERMDALVDGLDTVLRHPFAHRLPEHQRAELRAVALRIEAGFAEVLTAQRIASRVITTQVRHHDPLRDRQVDELLRDVVAALGAWMPTSRRAQPVEALRRLPRARVGRVRTTLADLTPRRGPEPLTEWDDDEAGSLEHAAAWGGPRYAALRGLLDEAGGARLDDVFAGGPDDARRPVDFVGLLELAARAGLDDLDEVAYVDTIRPDGTRRRLAFEAAALARAARTTAEGDTDD